jgi:hypothetical protein
MNKQQVMEALFSADCNISDDVISFIGANLPDANTKVIPFDHEEDHVFQACGIQEEDCAEMTEVLNDYMNTLPKNQRQQSRAVEYIVNSGNSKFIRIAVVAGLQKVRENATEREGSDLNELLLKALLKKLKDKDKDEE